MINLSKQIYVGWNSSTAELPEAGIIPIGDSSQEKKKLEKFVSNYITLIEHNNIPLPGFTLYTVGKKNYNSSDSTWLVIDPRGFLVRITQENMAAILQVTGITEGLIQQQCVWARDNNCSTMLLIPTSSPDYIEAVGNTELLESKVSISDVAIGDTVLLRNKLKGTYLGVQSLYCTMDNVMRGDFKVQTMIRRQVIEVSPGKFHYQVDAKILKVLAKATKIITRAEAALYLNNIINNNPAAYFTPNDRMIGHYYGSNGRVKLVSAYAVPKVPISLVEIGMQEATNLLDECFSNSDTGVLVVENASGKQFTIDFPWWGSAPTQVIKDEFFINEITEIKADHIIHAPKKSYYAGSYGQKPSNKLDNFTKFYKLVKSVKSDTYV